MCRGGETSDSLLRDCVVFRVFVALAVGGGGGARPATQAAAPVSSDVVKEAYRKRAESRRRQDANMSDKDRANMSRMLKQVRPPTPL